MESVCGGYQLVDSRKVYSSAMKQPLVQYIILNSIDDILIAARGAVREDFRGSEDYGR